MKMLLTGASGFIGTNLVAALKRDGVQYLNLDLAAPLCPEHAPGWQRVDILDAAALERAVRTYAPSHVMHLAARTDCDESTTVEEGYRANTEGTRNLLRAAAATSSIERMVLTSSQYVCGPGVVPATAETYGPHTVYGQSKARMEQIVREMNPAGTWTLVRPVNIWGPWHLRYQREIWRVLSRGLYVHPGRQPVIRTYGYVGNVVAQLLRILEAPRGVVHGRTFYLGDPPLDIYQWVNGFSLRLRGRPVRVAPRAAVRALAWFGDAAKLCGIKFPLTSSRYRSMTEDYWTPVEDTLRVLGPSPYTLEQGIEDTAAWLRALPEGS